MNTYKRLFNDTVIFAIGNLGSKLISFFLIPLYTFYLSTSEYGVVDLITVTSTMLVPVISLSIFQGVLRFAMDKNNNKSEIFTVGLLITFAGNLLFLILFIVINKIVDENIILNNVFLIVFFQSFQELFSQFARSIGKIKAYALNGILMAVTTSALSIYLIIKLNMGIQGYVNATILGNLISIILFSVILKIPQYINFKVINISSFKSILEYSIPLIPNSLSLRITNSASRFFIIFFLSASASGVFAIASKIPQLLSIFYQIFFQAWQLTAIDKFESKSMSEVYTKIFKLFSMLMFLFSSFILVILKPLMTIIVSNEFYSSWKYVPFILLGTVFSSFSGFLGTNYIAAKKTGGVLKTSIFGMIISLSLNIILIPSLGLNGAGMSLTISYAIIWIVRHYDTKKFVDIKLNVTNIILNIICFLFQTLMLYIISNIGMLITFELLLFSCSILINKELFLITYKRILIQKKNNRKDKYNEKAN